MNVSDNKNLSEIIEKNDKIDKYQKTTKSTIPILDRSIARREASLASLKKHQISKDLKGLLLVGVTIATIALPIFFPVASTPIAIILTVSVIFHLALGLVANRMMMDRRYCCHKNIFSILGAPFTAPFSSLIIARELTIGKRSEAKKLEKKIKNDKKKKIKNEIWLKDNANSVSIIAQEIIEKINTEISNLKQSIGKDSDSNEVETVKWQIGSRINKIKGLKDTQNHANDLKEAS